LYEGFFDFTPTHKTWLTTNHIPIVKGSDEGIWRRIHLIPFDQTIPAAERVRDFRETVLMPELAGILNWALEGLRDYLKNGLQPPARVLKASNEYREDMDVIGQWIAERAERNSHAFAPTSLLHANYAEWAQANVGWAQTVIAFGRELRRRGFGSRKDGRGISCVTGIRLKSGVAIAAVEVRVQ
jgi:putative DNA primase/helicase